jgi:uncharacterized protein YjbJ (UPF0337 family)
MHDNLPSISSRQEFANNVRQTWGKFTDDEIHQMAGKRDTLVSQIQKKYGITKIIAEQRIQDFELVNHINVLRQHSIA